MHKMSIDDLMTELDDARLTAKANGQASAMVAATMSKAKLLGLDKGVTDADEVQPVSIMINMVDARKPDQVCQVSPSFEQQRVAEVVDYVVHVRQLKPENPENTWDTAE